MIQHGVRIEAVATSLQQGESTDRIQQFPAYLEASWTQQNSNSTKSTNLQEEEEDRKSVQSAIGSSIFRAVLPGRIFILSGSSLSRLPVKAPRASSAFSPTETSF